MIICRVSKKFMKIWYSMEKNWLAKFFSQKSWRFSDKRIWRPTKWVTNSLIHKSFLCHCFFTNNLQNSAEKDESSTEILIDNLPSKSQFCSYLTVQCCNVFSWLMKHNFYGKSWSLDSKDNRCYTWWVGNSGLNFNPSNTQFL